MSEEVIKVLDELAKKFGIAIDWTSENVLPYVTDLCDRIVKYSIATNIASVIFTLLIFTSCTIGFIVTYKSYKKAVKTGENTLLWNYESYSNVLESSFCGFLLLIALVMITTFSVIGVITNVLDLLEILYLPEVVILDMLQEYM